MARSVAEFSMQLTVTSSTNSLAPRLEWVCRHGDYCSYSAPSVKPFSSPSQFTDFTQYRGNLLSLGGGYNEVILNDGSGLYGAFCPADSDCQAILYSQLDGRNDYAYCPIGTEMVVTAFGTVNDSYNYIFTPSPRVQLVGEMPATCLFINGGYRCESGQATLRFTHVESQCDTSQRVDCPIPLSGRTYGTCIADEPCIGLN